MVRPGSGRFGVGFWVGFWVGLRARDFPTEGVLSRTPLIIRTVDQKEQRPPEAPEEGMRAQKKPRHEPYEGAQLS